MTVRLASGEAELFDLKCGRGSGVRSTGHSVTATRSMSDEVLFSSHMVPCTDDRPLFGIDVDLRASHR